MSNQAQLEWEARAARPAAAVAFGSALFSIASIAIQVGAIGSRPKDDRAALIRFDEQRSDFFLSFGAQAISFVLLAGALYYLLRATAHRRAELPRFVVGLLILAPLLLIVGGLLNQIDLSDVADRFTSSGARTKDRAKDLLKDRNVIGGALGSGGTLSLALTFVLVGLNSMRAGLLSRFMGILGIIVGALGALFLGYWPGGRGPAWETGEQTPWPSATTRRQDAVPAPAGGFEQELEPADAPADGRQHPVSKKRRRKRKR